MWDNLIEFRYVNRETYISYYRKANNLLWKIAIYHNKKISHLFYNDVISYFEDNFKILFTFFEQDETITNIRFDNLVQRKRLFLLDKSEGLHNLRGLSVPASEDKTVIYLNQKDCPLERMIFTILHELCHIYFHIFCCNENDKQRYQNLTAKHAIGEYSNEGEVMETEANTIASLIYLPKEQLEFFLARGTSFGDIHQQSTISYSALHNRVLNYLAHVINLGYNEALVLLKDYEQRELKAISKVKNLVNQRTILKPLAQAQIRISTGMYLNEHECLEFLHRKTVESLCDELDYACTSKNQKLQILVHEEFYRRAQSE